MTEAPDYADAAMWYMSEAELYSNLPDEEYGSEADVFYILPTCVRDWTDSLGSVCHFADVRNPEHIAAMLPSNELAYDIFGKYADFYSPYYRQITLDSWTSDEIAEERFPYAMEDIGRAFDYYMEHWNKGRPFILAGFSQGAKCVMELLKSLDEEEYSRLIAAYVIGYKVTEDDMKNPNVRPARSADDIGVTVCYNSVESAASISPGLAASEFCINPLNWSCGPEPASVQDTVTVSVDTDAHVLIVRGLDSEKYYHPSLAGLFEKGNYHLLELTLYQKSLTKNAETRISAFLKKRFPVLAAAQGCPDVPPFDTLFGKDSSVDGYFRYGPYKLGDTTFFYEDFCYYSGYTERCRIYLDRDSASVRLKEFKERAQDMRHTRDHIAGTVRERKKNGGFIGKFDMRELEGIYVPLYSLGGELMMSEYLLTPFFISDSLLLYREMDEWIYPIDQVQHLTRDVTVVMAESMYEDRNPVVFWINDLDPERGVICVTSNFVSYVPEGYYVNLNKASSFPLLVWDSDSEPDHVRLPYERVTARDFY